MSGASDKARFYLEQSVPELHNWEKKGLFSKEEIQGIIKRRSSFEHVVNSREARPYVYINYITYELNVESLRRKRAKRLGVKSPSHAGQRRIYFLLDRATRKFPGDLDLWMQYVEYTRKQHAFKKVSQILTNALRLHPTKPDLWIYAAGFAMDENADMTEARSYMQRGLRFCQSSKTLWLEYAKLELMYINKIAARRRILGLDQANEKALPSETPADFDANLLQLPSVGDDDFNSDNVPAPEIDETALYNLQSSPVLHGAIPLAIFDAAIQRFSTSVTSFCFDFLNLLPEFSNLPCARKILDHILDQLHHTCSNDPYTRAWQVKAPTFGLDISSPEFPQALGQSLNQLKRNENLELARNNIFKKEIVQWLTELLGKETLDPALRKIIQSTLKLLAIDVLEP
ncbi:MAG: hypothetical protein Q9227_007914 [Pyrenula ochraceoflavens]